MANEKALTAEEVRRRYRANPASVGTLLDEVDAALEDEPESVALWCVRGDLVQAAGEGGRLPLEEALASYERALVLAPDSAKANLEIGVFHDLVGDDPEAAEPFLRAAVEHGGGEAAYVALARVLAEMDDERGALEVLEEAPDPSSDEVSQLRDEILAGEWAPEPFED